MVKLFMHNIFKYHGMPQSIVSDRDPRMTSLFWKALFENMGTTLKFSSSFHPQIDGQSEEANSTVLDLLKCYVSEHKATWEHYLPLVEYAYNNTVHTSTGKAPFEIVEGGKNFPPILQTKDKIFEADKYVQNTDEAYRKIKLALEKTQSKQKKAADRHRRELVFSLGDWVLLRFEKARLRKMKGKERLFPKLGMRYYGPFQVILCDVCGAEGFSECLAVCTRCNERAEHIYCVQAFCDALPPSWVCEGCKLAQLHACEKQEGTVVLNIDCNRTAQTFHEAKLQNKLCTLEQEQVEVEISSSSKGRLNISSSLPADSVPQVGTSRDVSVDNVRCMPTDCKSVSFQKQAGAKKLRHGAQGVPSSKKREPLPSFLLPSRPKIIPRSKNTCSPLSHVGANNKAEQSKGKQKHMEETIGLQSRKAVCVNSENQPVQGFECLARRNNPHAGILELPVAHGLLGKQPNLSSTHNAPQVSVINYARPARSERHQPQFLDPYQGRPFGQHARLQNVLCSVSSNAHAHNVTIIDNAPIHVPAAPYVQTLWRGSFYVDEGDNSSKVYKGIQGHPSSKADQKVWEAARSLPGLLRVKELQRGLDDSTWPKGFFLNPPSMECVGLFFFPVDMESHDSWYKPLVDRMMVYDLILRAESARLYLLIFHSQVFPEAEQLWDGRYYLWGMFRPKRGSIAQKVTVPQSVQGASDNTEVIDMDIDSDDTHRLAEMSQELALPPLPPGSPPPEPPPLPPGSPPPEPPSPVAQQTHEGGGSAAAKCLALLQEASCVVSHHAFDGEKKCAVPDNARETVGTHKIPVQEDILLNASGSKVEKRYEAQGFKAKSQNLNDASADGSLRTTVDSGSPLVELSSSLACKKSLQAAALKSVLKTNLKEGLVFSPFGHDILGGSSSCMSSQPRNQKASNGLERRHEEANLSTTTENCLAGEFDWTVVPDISGCWGAVGFPLFPVPVSHFI
ncbi:hypothetical protein L7F22_055649 [Adiantum nelumboides]|nr:hypothetical protein [Adiantum nelumboides]